MDQASAIAGSSGLPATPSPANMAFPTGGVPSGTPTRRLDVWHLPSRPSTGPERVGSNVRRRRRYGRKASG